MGWLDELPIAADASQRRRWGLQTSFQSLHTDSICLARAQKYVLDIVSVKLLNLVFILMPMVDTLDETS